MSKINPVDHPDDFDAFTKWLEVFRSRNGGWYPGDIKGWFDRVNQSHQFLRTKLGGIRREYNISLKSQQKPIAMADALPFINEILNIVPGYLEKDKLPLTKEVFLQPTMSRGTHQAIRVGKDVRAYAELILRYSLDKASQMKKLDTALAKLGELWARAKTSETELEATISTSPRSFMLLGHYGPDQDSCWRQGSDKTRDKYALGQSPNTFTVTIAAHKNNKLKNVARCFGWTNEYFETINTANYYFADKFSEGDGLEILKTIFSSLWNDKLEMHEDRQYIPEDKDGKGQVFHNQYGRWTFTKGQGSVIKRSSDCEFHPYLDMIKRFKCPKCRREYGSNDKDWSIVDEIYVCPICVDDSFLCELTNTRTFKDLVGYLHDNGEYMMVKPSSVVDAANCASCGIKHAIQMHTPDKRIVCTDCFEAEYEECESCHSFVPNEEMADLGDMDICDICLENGVSPISDEVLVLMNQELQA